MKRLNNKTISICILLAVAALSGCGKTATEIPETVEHTVNPYVRIDYFNSKGQILKEEYFGQRPYSIEYSYDDTGNVLNGKVVGKDAGRTIYSMNCYYTGKNLTNKILYDSDGVIQENTTYYYINGILTKVDRTSYSKTSGKEVEITEYDQHSGEKRKVSGNGWYVEYDGDTETRYEKSGDEYVVVDEKTSLYDENGNLDREVHSGSVLKYSYLDDGRIDRILTYIPDDSTDDNLSVGEVYEYDDEGHTVTKTTYRFFGERTEVEYVVRTSFDSRGNELKQSTNDRLDFNKEYIYYDNGKIREIRYLM